MSVHVYIEALNKMIEKPLHNLKDYALLTFRAELSYCYNIHVLIV